MKFTKIPRRMAIHPSSIANVVKFNTMLTMNSAFMNLCTNSTLYKSKQKFQQNIKISKIPTISDINK